LKLKWIKFSFAPAVDNQYLYVKENYFPDWQAKVKTNRGEQKLEIYNAGAGHMLVKLPEGINQISFEYKASTVNNLSKIVSILTLGMLILWLFWNKPISGPGLVKKIINNRFKKWWEQENEV